MWHSSSLDFIFLASLFSLLISYRLRFVFLFTLVFSECLDWTSFCFSWNDFFFLENLLLEVNIDAKSDENMASSGSSLDPSATSGILVKF